MKLYILSPIHGLDIETLGNILYLTFKVVRSKSCDTYSKEVFLPIMLHCISSAAQIKPALSWLGCKGHHGQVKLVKNKFATIRWEFDPLTIK